VQDPFLAELGQIEKLLDPSGSGSDSQSHSSNGASGKEENKKEEGRKRAVNVLKGAYALGWDVKDWCVHEFRDDEEFVCGLAEVAVYGVEGPPLPFSL
jgi:hypothetical protein